MVRHIPNLLTLGNAFCGCVGIVQLLQGHWQLTALFVGIALVFDFADGFVARALRVHSELGKQLDSLSDAITFGVLPAFIAFIFLIRATHLPNDLLQGDLQAVVWWHYSAFLIAVCSVLRLARFNIDTRQSDTFIGVPTPANAILWTSLLIIVQQQPFYQTWLYNLYVLIPLIFLMSFLLVAELPLFSLKFKNFTWKDNQIKYIFLILSLLLVLLLKYLALPLMIVLYIAISVIHNIIKK
ncbi:MAG: CDP-diacylglycerol--serine O-phosphatidyltransferase [Thermonemataceae bacterium]